MEVDESFTLAIDPSSLLTEISIGDGNETTVTIANDDCKLIIRMKQNYFILCILISYNYYYIATWGKIYPLQVHHIVFIHVDAWAFISYILFLPGI